MKKTLTVLGLCVTLAASAALCACNGAGKGQGSLSATDVYGIGAVSAAKLLGSNVSAQAMSTFSAVRGAYPAEAENTETGVKAQVDKFNEYFTALDSFLGEDVVTTTAETNTDEKYPFGIKLTIRGKDVAGNTAEYVMYYTETHLQTTTEEDDGETETESIYKLDGIMVIDGQDYFLEGVRAFEEEAGETENELKIRAYADKENRLDYIEMEQELSAETGESETEYVYRVFSQGRLAEETAVSFETERKGAKEETEYELEFRTGEGRGKYEIERERENGVTQIKVKYNLNGQNGTFRIREITDKNGEKQYEYTFSDNSTKVFDK